MICTAKYSIHHDGKWYEIGDAIELTEAEAKALDGFVIFPEIASPPLAETPEDVSDQDDETVEVLPKKRRSKNQEPP